MSLERHFDHLDEELAALDQEAAKGEAFIADCGRLYTKAELLIKKYGFLTNPDNPLSPMRTEFIDLVLIRSRAKSPNVKRLFLLQEMNLFMNPPSDRLLITETDRDIRGIAICQLGQGRGEHNVLYFLQKQQIRRFPGRHIPIVHSTVEENQIPSDLMNYFETMLEAIAPVQLVLDIPIE